MEYKRLGRSDLQVSNLGLGCANFGKEVDQQTSFAIMDRAVERGINFIDTAEVYSAGVSEEIVGQWLAARGTRKDIVLATKVTLPLHRERILQSVEASLRRLQVDHIDLYQLHTFDDNTPLEETLETLSLLVDQGKVRYIGCSNFAAWQLCKALWKQDVHGWPRFETIQPIFNLVHDEAKTELFPLCRDQELGVISYSPLGAGFLTGKYREGAPIPAGTNFDGKAGLCSIYFKPSCFSRMERLRVRSQELSISMTHLALSWVFQQPGITTVLIGARNTAQLDQAFEVGAMQISPDVFADLLGN